VVLSTGQASCATSTLAAGSHPITATYGGDTNFAPSTSAPLSQMVNQEDTSTGTALHKAADGSVIPAGSQVPLDTSVFDTATLTGITPTGTVTYQFFTNETCTAPASSETVALGRDSSPTAPLGAGSYSFRAVYNGDTNHIGSTSPCEPFIVNKAPASQITHGGTACQAFIAGASTSVPDAHYSVKGTIIDGVNPGVFSSFTQLLAPAADFTASIVQTNNSVAPLPYPNIPIDDGRVVLYTSACKEVTAGVAVTFPSTGNANLTVTGATPGATYIVNVMYSLTSLKGGPVPAKNPLTYTFSADVNGTLVADSRQDLLFETP
jgi:hypothetical protein